MQIFVYEYLSSGADNAERCDSAMSREGWAMLHAALEDFSRLPGCRVVTLLRPELQPHAPTNVRVEVCKPASVERELFTACVTAADASFVIAPECGGLLAERRRMVDEVGDRFLGHSLAAIELCADKLRLFAHLEARGIPSVPTTVIDVHETDLPFEFPVVVKPRDGAGSTDVYRIADRRELADWRSSASRDTSWIVQPFVEGTAISVSVIADSSTGNVEVFPVGEQMLSSDRRFHYRGGRISTQRDGEAARALVRTACNAIDGLAGYIGFDLISRAATGELIVVEANPRLTTSYLGYRALTKENLAERMLDPGKLREPLRWSDAAVDFSASGEVVRAHRERAAHQ